MKIHNYSIGQLVKRIELPEHTATYQIDMQDIANGLYQVKVYVDDHLENTTKIEKQ